MLTVLIVLTVAVAIPAPAAHATPDLAPYRGLGTWVDVFDYAPRLRTDGSPPPFTVGSVDDMAAVGVRTLYLQVANPDDASPASLTDAKLVKAIIARAHRRDIDVVAWYLPSLVDVARDYALLRRIAALPVDGIGLDIEATDVADVPTRNDRAVALAKRVRTLVGDSTPIAAIVYPAVQLEKLNTTLWPNFPYRRLAPSIDVWMPMVYFTFRSEESGLRSAETYSVDSIKLLRTRLDDQHAPVHLIGGIADLTTTQDLVDLRRAVRTTDSIGWSLYDYGTTSSAAWPYLRR